MQKIHVIFEAALFSLLVAVGVAFAATIQDTAASSPGNFRLLVLHNNDMHARFEETSPRSGVCKGEDKKLGRCVGGFARVAHVVREARRQAREGSGPQTVFLNAGDTYTGTPWYSIHKWRIVADFMNLLKPDAASFGNHEFDDNIAGIVPFVQAAGFPIVAANLDFSEEPALQATNVTKSVVLDIAGHRIGVIGYLTDETIKISATGKVKFADEVESVRMESERLDAQGIKIIVALGHSGFYVDQKIARQVPLVDVVVGGHTNTFLWNGIKKDLEEPEGDYPRVVEQKSGKKVPVVQAYAYTKYMGKLFLEFDHDGNAVKFYGQPLLLDSSVEQDEDVLELLDRYRPEMDALNEVVGRTKVYLDGDSATCRVRECNFGNLIADAFVSRHSAGYKGEYWTDAPIGFINGGAIRNVIEPKTTDGNITKAEILGALPFGDTIFSVTLNGSNLLKTLELGARADGETSRGEFLQVSGIHYKIDFARPPLSRVSDVQVRCGSCNIPDYEPLDPSKHYRVIATRFLVEGGDGHTVFRDYGINRTKEDLNDLDTVVDYFKKHSPVYPAVEERITVVNSHLAFDRTGNHAAKKTPFLLVLPLLLSILKIC